MVDWKVCCKAGFEWGKGFVGISVVVAITLQTVKGDVQCGDALLCLLVCDVNCGEQGRPQQNSANAIKKIQARRDLLRGLPLVVMAHMT